MSDPNLFFFWFTIYAMVCLVADWLIWAKHIKNHSPLKGR